MALTRIAFLIGDGHSGGGPLPGVAADHRILRRFLESDGGGAWRSNEILDISTISEADLTGRLAFGVGRDYALVVFSGHGFVAEEDGRTYCCINDEESVNELGLTTGAGRQCTIIDACRVVTPLGPLRKSERTVLGGIQDDARAQPYRDSCRSAYDAMILRSDPGLSFVYACTPGETAGDSPGGGLFLASLVDVARTWVASTKTPGAVAHAWLSVSGALDSAKNGMAAMRIPQHPIGYLGKRKSQFPFAVA
jgi:hypothetical protein